jgi:signal transduction histidine kinase/CheY-like chemotaxis protein
MDRLDQRRKVFYHYRASLPNSIHNDYVSSIITDPQGNLWIGTGFGIDVLEKNTGNVRHYSVDRNQLSSDNVTWLYMDSKQRLWAATREGLDVLCPDEKAFQVFTTEDGLPDNTIRDIEEDSLHRLWVSTANGLSRISVVPSGDHTGLRIRCRNFHEQDGLQGREFNERTGMETRDGSMLFGGPNGFNIFRPEDIAPARKAPPIVLTGLEVFDKNIKVGDQTGGHTILQKALTETGKITLTHYDNVFSIEFASLGYIPNATNRYAYKLEGFSRNWLITDGKIRKATYTNLDAGDYVFRVKASDEDGQWYDKEATLQITVLPPWWKTELAYIVYILLLAGTLLLARRMVLRRAKMRFALENERRETRRMHEMDLMKIRFFTNMSHELRTPLSLILAPVDKLLNNAPQTDSRRQYEMIRRNARRLLHLVNQLLDFRKMEEGELKLHLREGDVVRFVKDISLSFVDLAERKNIQFALQEDSGPLFTRFDHDKLERILFNLLSNAFKFTPKNGKVTVQVQTERPTPPAAAALPEELDEALLSIAIADTGIGIEPDKQEKIFERFFQNEVPDTILNQGSGIGLSITQEFVRMHGGRLTVKSEVGKGSCFTVLLPFKEIKVSGLSWTDAGGPEEVAPEEEGSGLFQPVVNGVNGVNGVHGSNGIHGANGVNGVNGHPTVNGTHPANVPKGAPTILIVEDNEEFRFYLKDNLRDFYKIIEASDGKEGWKKVLSAQPQLVVSDISMPHMDGIQLCRKIRNDERTRQIPVILLTAMSGETVELEGIQTGATDYITKPFNFEVLLSKIRNVVEYNETVRKTWQRRVETGTAPVEMTSPDEVFLRGVLAHIEKNIGDPDLSVEALSQQFHASRSTFYKRLVLLTGKTPVELIRHIRLQRAAELLEKSQFTVAEIAYTVGFNNPKYFTQYFKSAFDCIPSVYRAERKEQRL